MSLSDIKTIVMDKVQGKSKVGMGFDLLVNTVKDHIDNFNIAGTQTEVMAAINSLISEGKLIVNEVGDIISSQIG